MEGLTQAHAADQWWWGGSDPGLRTWEPAICLEVALGGWKVMEKAGL